VAALHEAEEHPDSCAPALQHCLWPALRGGAACGVPVSSRAGPVRAGRRTLPSGHACCFRERGAEAGARAGCARGRVVFIEVVTHKDDCSRELLEWGSRVATANSRPPNPQ